MTIPQLDSSSVCTDSEKLCVAGADLLLGVYQAWWQEIVPWDETQPEPQLSTQNAPMGKEARIKAIGWLHFGTCYPFSNILGRSQGYQCISEMLDICLNLVLVDLQPI